MYDVNFGHLHSAEWIWKIYTDKYAKSTTLIIYNWKCPKTSRLFMRLIIARQHHNNMEKPLETNVDQISPDKTAVDLSVFD